MRSRFRRIVQHSVAKNSAMLLAVSMLNYVAPLILIPFLARTLGVELYGVYAFGVSLYLMALIVIDYGFPIHGLYSISEHRNDPERVGRLLGSMLAIKLGLFVVLGALLTTLVWFSERYVEHRLFLSLTTLPLLGAVLQFRWVFQAVEQSVKIFYYMAAGRILHVVLVIALVAGPEDYLWVPISQGIAMILSGMVCIGMIRRLGYQFQMPGWDDVREQLRGAASYFWVKIAGAHLSFAGVFSLGLVGSPAKVALYGSAEQVYRAIYAAYEPFYEALTAYTKRTNDVRMVRRLFAVVFGGTVLLGVLGMVLAPYLIDLLFGAAFAGATQNLQILLFGLLLGVPSGMISYPLLGSMGCGPQINRVIILSAIATLSVLGLLWHGNMLSGTAVALTMVASEAFKLSGLLLLLRRVRFQSQFA